MTDKNILNNITNVFKSKDINKLNGSGYHYLYLLSGFIAHYDINGFKSHYTDLRTLINDILSSDAESDIKNLVLSFSDQINKEFSDQERKEDLNTIHLLMRKNQLKEVKLK